MEYDQEYVHALKERIKRLEKENKRLTDKVLKKENSSFQEGDKIFNHLSMDLPDVIWTMDLEMNYTYLSPSTEKIFGYSISERETITIHDVFPPETIELFKSKLVSQMQLAKTKPEAITSTKIEARANHKNGESLWVEVHADFIKDEYENITGIQGITRNITDRKKAQEKLQQTEHALKESFENLKYILKYDPNAIAVFDENLHYMYVSDRYLKDYNVDEKDITGRHHYEVFPEIPERWREIHQRALNGEILKNDDDFFERPDGSITYNRWECRPWYKTGGEIGGMITYTEVITKRKKAEIKLKESEQNLKIITENSNDLISRFSPTGKFLYVSPSIKKLMGYSVEEFKNRHYLDGVFEHDKENLKKYFIKLLEGVNDEETNISRFYKKDGTLIWLETSATLVYNDQGNLKDIVTIGRDVSDRINKEIEFKKIHSRYETIAKYFPNGAIFLFDNTLTYNMVAGKALSLIGLTPEDCTGKKINEVFPEDVQKEAIPNGKKILEGQNVYYEVNYKNMIFGNWGVPIKNSGGQIEEALVFAVNITDLKRNEQELISAKEKAEQSDRLKSAFLANMSHEIRTPMNGIIGFSDMLNKIDISDAKRESYIKIIQDSSHQLLNIVNDVLDISKLETGEITINEESINLNDVLAKLFSFFNPKTKDKNLILITKPGLHSKDSIIKIDPTKLKQILSNLLSNAIKFTDKGHVKFGYEVLNEKLHFFVEDTGIGIPKKMHEVIFERFRQVDYSADRHYGGTGLGLSICKKLIDLLQGKIWVESEPEKGTTFYFTVPYVRASEHTRPEPTKEQSGNKITGKQTILIAEDEVINYIFLNEILEEHNFTTIHACDGKQAVDLCTAHPEISAVLMDIKMPVMNGFDATQQIKKLRPELPVIAQTAYAMTEDRDKALQSGCNDYLSKPVNKNDLLEILNKYLGIK